MIKAVFRFIGGIFRFFLRGLDLLRRVVLNLAFIVIIGVLIALFWLPEPGVPDASVLVLRPSGALVEQTRLESPLKLLDPRGDGGGQTELFGLVKAVRAATDDERIRALVIETDELAPGGISKLSELRAAIETFKTSGKPVIARGERFMEGQYYLASAADELHMSPDGFLLLRGLASYSSYFGNALEKLGIKVHVFRVGEYKSFAEPFTRADMSDEDRESTRDLLTGLWNAFIDDIATSRALEPAQLQHYVADFGAVLDAAGGDPARAAVDSGLVDHLTTRDEWTALLRSRFGATEQGNGYRGITIARYLSALPEAHAAEGSIAVLVAQGAIMDGSGAPGTVGGDAFAHLIREARENDAVRALVVRIDSPGGSAWASEQIRRELEITRDAGKPVIASMSSTAASGGYWIAAGADEIYAHPLTLTGSIGIFALFPDVSEPLARLGVTNDGVATGPLAGVPDPRRPLEPAAVRIMQSAIEHGYRRFLETVAQSRDMSLGEADLLARGRVWTGEAANKMGLVDALGGIEDAIAAAARLADIQRYDVVWPESSLSPREILMRRVTGLLGLEVKTPPMVAASSPLGTLFTSLQRDFDALLSWNDPRHLYVHCLCEGP